VKAYSIPEGARGIVFDIDGTLYSDSAYGHDQVSVLIERLAEARGASVGETEKLIEETRVVLARRSGTGTTSLGNVFLALGVPIETSVEWRERLLVPERYLKPDERLKEAIRALSGDYRICAVTNNPTSIGIRTLKALGIAEFFRVVIGLEATMVSKPAPEPFLRAARELGLTPGELISVGDRFDVDLAVPLELGMGAILVDGVEDAYALPALLTAPRSPGTI
jgi:FMN phosphatase YigB (HAD superfamily)